MTYVDLYKWMGLFFLVESKMTENIWFPSLNSVTDLQNNQQKKVNDLSHLMDKVQNKNYLLIGSE
jgi:hypothetical protein